MRFPAKKNACRPRDFPPRKDGVILPRSGCLGTPLPFPQSLYGRTDGRTLRSEPKFVGSIGYQISLPKVLRSAAFGRKGAPVKMHSIKMQMHTFLSGNPLK